MNTSDSTNRKINSEHGVQIYIQANSPAGSMISQSRQAHLQNRTLDSVVHLLLFKGRGEKKNKKSNSPLRRTRLFTTALLAVTATCAEYKLAT